MQVSYMNFERTKLPEELMKADLLRHSGLEPDRQDIEVQTEGVYNQRLQNLAITLDKVSYFIESQCIKSLIIDHVDAPSSFLKFFVHLRAARLLKSY